MDDGSVTFDALPWPILAAHKHSERVILSLDDLNADAISGFLFVSSADRKEKVRETFLRFHPDKFEGRFMSKVQFKERERVREGLVQVVRVLNALGTNST